MYRLNLFGTFSLIGPDGAPVRLTSRKARALIAFLALGPGKPRSREEIMALLWSDRGEAQARASLRQALTGLRRDLGAEGAGLLRIEEDSIALDPRKVSVEAANGEPFLAGLSIRDPAFEDWLRDTRLSFGDEVADALGAKTAQPERPYVAVLPFANLSGDPEQQYFADGLTEDIIAELSRFPTLWVIGRSSSFAFTELDQGERDAGGRLGVSYLVEGSVRKAGDRVRITAQLVDAKSTAHLWADRYERGLDDIFAVQDEVVASVVANLGLSLDGVKTAEARRRPTNMLNAYDLLLRARSAWWHGNDREAFAFARRAVEADPDFARAHAYLALQNAYQFYSGTQGLSLGEIADNCRFHAEAALALDENDPIVHAYASMAFGFSPLLEKQRGLTHVAIASRLNPHDCEIMLFQAWQLAFAGKPREALVWLERARRLNPLGGYMISACYADTQYMNRDYVAALDSFSGQAEAPPAFAAVFVAALAQLGRLEEARACAQALDGAGSPGFRLGDYALAQIATCLREEDREHWRQGFRLAGLDV